MKKFTDRNGVTIKAGDILQGPSSSHRDCIREVVMIKGELHYSTHSLTCVIDFDGNEEWSVDAENTDHPGPDELWVSEYEENKEMIDNVRIIGNKENNPELLTSNYLNRLKRKWPSFNLRAYYSTPNEYDF